LGRVGVVFEEAGEGFDRFAVVAGLGEGPCGLVGGLELEVIGQG